MLAASEDGADLAALTDVIERGGGRPGAWSAPSRSRRPGHIDHVSGGHARGKVVTVNPWTSRVVSSGGCRGNHVGTRLRRRLLDEVGDGIGGRTLRVAAQQLGRTNEVLQVTRAGSA